MVATSISRRGTKKAGNKATEIEATLLRTPTNAAVDVDDTAQASLVRLVPTPGRATMGLAAQDETGNNGLVPVD